MGWEYEPFPERPVDEGRPVPLLDPRGGLTGTLALTPTLTLTPPALTLTLT